MTHAGVGLKIVFVEVGACPRPVGGARVLYDYASRLAERGHEVSVVHPVAPTRPERLLKRLRLRSRWRRWKRDGRWRPTWATISPKVTLLWTPDLSARSVPAADVVVATGFKVVQAVADLPVGHGAKAFLSIHWDFGYVSAADEAPLQAAWRQPMARIVTARTIQAEAAALGFAAGRTTLGLDFWNYGVDTPLAERDPNRVALLHHTSVYKGFADAMAALELVRAQRPGLVAEMFGPGRPEGLPDWVVYHAKPSDADIRALYNRVSIFTSASHNEGWGLPPCEAGLCGAALALSENLGHREFGVHERTALMSPIRDPAALAANIVRLMDDADLRARLNAELRAELAQYDWDSAVDGMETLLLAAAGRA